MSRRTQDRMSDIALLLYKVIQTQPGIHFRSLGRAARLSSVGQLRHHLDHLRRQGVIVEVKDGRFKRFFVAGEHEPQLRQGLARFARRVPRRIGLLLLARPMNRTELRRTLDCADSTLGYHLNRMVALGDLERTRGRNCCMYSLTDPDFVRDLLRHQAPTSATHPTGETSSVPEPGIATTEPGIKARTPGGSTDLAPRYGVHPPGASPADATPARPGDDADRPGRGIRALADRSVVSPEATTDGSSRAVDGLESGGGTDRGDTSQPGDESTDGDGSGRTRARPAGRIHVVPRKPPEIVTWHGRR